MLYPTIGIPRAGKGIFHHYTQFFCIRCLQRAGATVEVLPARLSPDAADPVLTRCDGFLFSGGPDIRPEYYGENRLPACGESDPERDESELLLLRAALENYRPLFCIGRGMQLLNILFGGTLMQDMGPNQEYRHLDLLHHTTATHPVDIDPDSLLFRILGSDTASVNSLHHQAVRDVGEGLWIPADSPEGHAEALQMDDHPFCLAVQWHPELMTARTPAQQKLFQAFVKACRPAASGHSSFSL